MVFSTWLSRDLQQSLENYKQLQSKIAKSKGKYQDLMDAKTLTQARKAVYGSKEKSYMGYKGHPDLEEKYRNFSKGKRK